MRISTWVLAVAAVLVACTGWASEPAKDADDFTVAMQRLRERLPTVEEMKATAPKDYIIASQLWAEEVLELARRYESVPRSYGARQAAISQLMKTADFARRKMRDPQTAIVVYTKAEAINDNPASQGSSVSMHEQIADIYEYDLGDHAAAAKTLRELRSAVQHIPMPARKDYAAWLKWRLRWLDAEIRFLETGTRFDGAVLEDDVSGFLQHLFFSAGGESTNGEPLAPEFNMYNQPRDLSDRARKTLLDLPPSHSIFLRTWMFAARLDRESARQWLERNDKAGFWRACLLRATALADRANVESHAAGSDMLKALARTPAGDPSGLALLARESADRLPKTKH